MTITVADWCIFVAGMILPMIFTVYAKASKEFDNSKPRDFLEKVEGARKRSYWAAQNGYETFPLFTAAVLLAERAAVGQGTVNLLALAYIGLRLVFGVLYIADKPTLRSLTWVASIGCIVTLFTLAS